MTSRQDGKSSIIPNTYRSRKIAAGYKILLEGGGDPVLSLACIPS